MRWQCVVRAALAVMSVSACQPFFKPGGLAPSLKGSFDKTSIAPGESAALTWQTSREGDYVVFVNTAIFSRSHASATTALTVTVPATALQIGSNPVVVSLFTDDAREAHLPLTLALATPGSSSGAGSSSGTSAGTGSSSGGGSGPFSIGGSASGLYGNGLTLQLASAGATSESLPVASGGSTFSFATLLAAGSTYTVTITAQPNAPAQICSLTAGTQSGTANANVSSVAVTCAAPSASDLPRLVFSDLTQAPAGAYVTLYGFNLDGVGARVTVGGVATTVKVDVTTAPARSLELIPLKRIVVQLPSTMVAGSQPLLFYKFGRVPSAALPFTVASGRVLFYSATGSGDGSSEAAPANYSAMLSGVLPGDVRYLRAGSVGGLTWSMTPILPVALVGYPGETVVVTTTTATVVAAISGSNLSLSNLTFGPTGAAFAVGGNGAQDVVVSGSSIRLVGNTWVAPAATNTGIVQLYLGGGSEFAAFGNDFKANDDGSANGGSNVAVAQSSGVNGLDFGYNELEGCRETNIRGSAIDFGPPGSADTVQNISVHHNRMLACSGTSYNGELIGLNFSSNANLLNASFENNLMLGAIDLNPHRGTFYLNLGGTGTYQITVNHNTIVQSQTVIDIEPSSGSDTPFVFENNLVVSSAGTPFGCASGAATCTTLAPTSVHNDWFGLTQLPPSASDTALDPVLDGNGNRTPTAASAALIGQASDTATNLTDYVGIARPQGSAPDIGVFEYVP